MDERITALLERLADEDGRAEELATLDDEALAALADELRDTFRAVRAGEVEGTEPDDLGALSALRDGVSAIEAEQGVRAEAAAQAEAEAAQRAEEAAALEAEVLAEPEVAEEPEAETAETAEAAIETETEVEAELEPTVETEPATAAARPAVRRPSLAEMAARRPASAAPRVESHGPRWQDTSGREVVDHLEMAERVIAAQEDLRGMSTPPGFSQRIPVVRLQLDRPAELTLGDDLESNVAKINAATHAHESPAQRAVVASGGWCAPGEPRYDIPNISSGERPFRDSLVRMGATRGSVNFVRAARLATILANTTAAAVTTWENSTDQTPGESTKTRQTHACRSVVTEELGAVVARMRFGNFQQRAFPEDIAHDLSLLEARHARVAEVRLLDALIGDINVDVTETGLVGTSRDTKLALIQAAAQLRSVERIGRGSPIRAVLPREALDMAVADVLLQQASGELDALMVDVAWAERFYGTSGVNLTYVSDTPTGADAFVTNSDAGGQSLADFPDDFEIPIFPDGHAVFADGGTLDLGIIRDSTLNNTNDYEVFMETFEGLLWLGPFGVTVTLTTCANGESQVATDETGSICSGS